MSSFVETTKKSQLAWNLFRYGMCVIVTLLVIVPLYIAITGGFKTMGQLMTAPMALPNPFMAEHYTDLLTGKVGTFWQALVNSVIVTGLTVLFQIVLCAAAAFALARIHFRLNGVIYNYFLLGLLFPLAVAILPLYLQLRNLGLLDRYWGVVLPQVAFQIPWQIMLMRGFFRAIPRDLEDACSMDGHGPLGFLWHMVIPLSAPILSTSAILTLVASWNNFFLPLLAFNSQAKFTLPLGIMAFMGQHATDWTMILAYLTMAMIPAVIFFILAQKYIVAGLTGGALKG